MMCGLQYIHHALFSIHIISLVHCVSLSKTIRLSKTNQTLNHSAALKVQFHSHQHARMRTYKQTHTLHIRKCVGGDFPIGLW